MDGIRRLICAIHSEWLHITISRHQQGIIVDITPWSSSVNAHLSFIHFISRNTSYIKQHEK